MTIVRTFYLTTVLLISDSGNIDLISLLLQGQSQAQSQNASVGGTTYSLQNQSPVPVYQPYYANYQQGMSPYQKLLQYWVMMNRMYVPGMQITNDPRFPGGGVVTAGDGRDGTVVNRYGMRATVDGTDISWDGGWWIWQFNVQASYVLLPFGSCFQATWPIWDSSINIYSGTGGKVLFHISNIEKVCEEIFWIKKYELVLTRVTRLS